MTRSRLGGAFVARRAFEREALSTAASNLDRFIAGTGALCGNRGREGCGDPSPALARGLLEPR